MVELGVGIPDSPGLLPHSHKMAATTPGISLHKTIFKSRKKEMANVAKNISPFMLLSLSSLYQVPFHGSLPYQSLPKEIRFIPEA